MTNEQLIETIVENDNTVTKAAAKRALKCIFENISDELKAGGKVSIPGFGTFSTSEAKERKGRNLQTGKDIIIPAHTSPKFKAAPALKAKVKEK